MMLSNKTYDKLKWVAMIAMPALGTLYFTVSGIWSLPYAEQVMGTIMALNVCLGTLLGISTRKYRQG